MDSPLSNVSNVSLPFFLFSILDISRIIYIVKLMYNAARCTTHANILEICCNPVDEFHLWLMYINITRCV